MSISMTRQPNFWYQQTGLASIKAACLTPAALLWRLAGFTRRCFASPSIPPCPLICVGNLTIGGTGKTPLVAELCRLAKAAGKQPVVLASGYGGWQHTPHQVTSNDSAAMVGDEALELYAGTNAPVVIARKRAAGMTLAAGLGDIIIMDDGFQNPSVTPTRSVLVFDGSRGIGNGHIIPSGPLREGFARGLARASHAVIIGADQTGLVSRITHLAPHIRLTQAEKDFTAHAKKVITSKPAPLLAFAGIGNPQSFFNLITHNGGNIASRQAFADHHPYSSADLNMLIARARRDGLKLVTTMKDSMRIPPKYRQHITPLGIGLVIEAEFCRGLLFGDGTP